jgi:hypothetical protein
MADALQDIGREVVADKSYEEPLKRFTDAVHCEFNLGKTTVLGRAAPPQAAEESAFRALVRPVSH